MRAQLYTRIVPAISLLIVGIILWPGAFSALVSIKEKVVLAEQPSAERAYEYGNQHFDARTPIMYDIDRARELYEYALQLDPSLSGARHQLGRIAFLRGDIHTALIYLNAEIAMPQGPVSPSSYYMRGLIEGYMGKYDDAISDYAKYLESDPTNWAATTDYAWVLLKANRPGDALAAIEKLEQFFPNNPWLLNTKATALFELGRYEEALAQARLALDPSKSVTEGEWHTAYPGNDPRIARVGIQTLQDAIKQNIHTIEAKLRERRIQYE